MCQISFFHNYLGPRSPQIRPFVLPHRRLLSSDRRNSPLIISNMPKGESQLSRGFYGLRYERRHFEIKGNSIVSYTRHILMRNMAHDKHLTREEVQWNWDAEVYEAYGSEDPQRALLLGQVRQHVSISSTVRLLTMNVG